MHFIHSNLHQNVINQNPKKERKALYPLLAILILICILIQAAVSQA